MSKVHVTAKKDFIESLVVSKPIPALAELIWNGFDSGSNSVEVSLTTNDMDGLESVRIRDFGYGIEHSKVTALFGGLGESWKKSAYKQFGRALHGKNGKGRLKAFALGEKVQWTTCYKIEGKIYSYSIVGHLNTIEDFDITDPVLESDHKSTGTEVVISNMLHDFKSFRDGTANLELARTYAAYLTEYPNLSLTFNRELIDPSSAQIGTTNIHLDSVITKDGRALDVSMSVIE